MIKMLEKIEYPKEVNIENLNKLILKNNSECEYQFWENKSGKTYEIPLIQDNDVCVSCIFYSKMGFCLLRRIRVTSNFSCPNLLRLNLTKRGINLNTFIKDYENLKDLIPSDTPKEESKPKKEIVNTIEYNIIPEKKSLYRGEPQLLEEEYFKMLEELFKGKLDQDYSGKDLSIVVAVLNKAKEKPAIIGTRSYMTRGGSYVKATGLFRDIIKGVNRNTVDLVFEIIKKNDLGIRKNIPPQYYDDDFEEGIEITPKGKELIEILNKNKDEMKLNHFFIKTYPEKIYYQEENFFIFIDNRKLHLNFPYDDSVVKAIKTIKAGYREYNENTKTWSFDATKKVISHIITQLEKSNSQHPTILKIIEVLKNIKNNEKEAVVTELNKEVNPNELFIKKEVKEISKPEDLKDVAIAKFNNPIKENKVEIGYWDTGDGYLKLKFPYNKGIIEDIKKDKNLYKKYDPSWKLWIIQAKVSSVVILLKHLEERIESDYSEARTDLVNALKTLLNKFQDKTLYTTDEQIRIDLQGEWDYDLYLKIRRIYQEIIKEQRDTYLNDPNKDESEDKQFFAVPLELIKVRWNRYAVENDKNKVFLTDEEFIKKIFAFYYNTMDYRWGRVIGKQIQPSKEMDLNIKRIIPYNAKFIDTKKYTYFGDEYNSIFFEDAKTLIDQDLIEI